MRRLHPCVFNDYRGALRSARLSGPAQTFPCVYSNHHVRSPLSADRRAYSQGCTSSTPTQVVLRLAACQCGWRNPTGGNQVPDTSADERPPAVRYITAGAQLARGSEKCLVAVGVAVFPLREADRAKRHPNKTKVVFGPKGPVLRPEDDSFFCWFSLPSERQKPKSLVHSC